MFKKSKSYLHYTRLIPFRVSQVSGANLSGFAPRPTIKVAKVASRWQRVGDLVSSESEPIPLAPEANVLMKYKYTCEIHVNYSSAHTEF